LNFLKKIEIKSSNANRFKTERTKGSFVDQRVEEIAGKSMPCVADSLAIFERDLKSLKEFRKKMGSLCESMLEVIDEDIEQAEKK
jgi:hypothetical protein